MAPLEPPGEAIGAVEPGSEQHRAIDTAAKHVLLERTGSTEGTLNDIGISSMRQLANAVRGPTPEVEIPSVAGVRGRPSTVPDCFTDGSLKQPQAEHCALGGAGLWLPNCNVHEQ